MPDPSPRTSTAGARGSDGDMISFGAFTPRVWDQEPQARAHYGGTRALELSGAAMSAMEEMLADMPGGYGTTWAGLSFQERLSDNQAPLLFALSALVCSWPLPRFRKAGRCRLRS